MTASPIDVYPAATGPASPHRSLAAALDDDDVASTTSFNHQSTRIMVDGEHDAVGDQTVHANPPVRVPLLETGTMVGRYVVLEHLGSGGLGDVFTAWDPELDRKIALKLLKSAALRHGELGDIQGRMLREAQAMARLAHPNVVTVHDVGLSDNQIFIAMEFVEGVTLKVWLEQGTHGWREIRDVLVQAGAGLLAAHDAGLVHRDFKPSNVLVSTDGRVRVLDFGLARSPSANRPRTSSGSDDREVASTTGVTSSRPALVDEVITQTGFAVGTPAYMAPEQHLGGWVDAQADQFGFCVAAFEAFWGARPFQGRAAALSKAIREGDITFPSPEPPLPTWLRKAVLRGLSVLPDDRYPSMRALLDALQWDRRSKRKKLLMLGLSAVLCAGGGASLFAALAPPPLSQDSGVDRLVHAAHEAAAKSYFVYPPPDATDTQTAYQVVLHLEGMDGELEELARATAHDLRAEFSATLAALGDRYWDVDGGAPFATDYYAQALLFDPSDERARERIVMTPGELAVLRDKATGNAFSSAELEAANMLAALANDDEQARDKALAKHYRNKGRRGALTTDIHVEALLGPKAVEVLTLDQAPSAEPPQLADAQAHEPGATQPADEGSQNPSPTKVADPSAEAKDDERTNLRSSPSYNPELARTLVEQGLAAMARGDLKGAERLLHRALGADRRSHDAMMGLSELHYQKGDYRDAASFAAQAVQLAPKRGDYRIQLGDAYFKVMRYDEAREQYDQAAALNHPRAAGRIQRLADKLGG